MRNVGEMETMFSNFFIDRPIFATVVSLTIFALGAVAFVRLPVAQYPEVTPPVVNVTATYPGADAETVAKTIAVPIERQILGVDRSVYFSSTCGSDGTYSLNVSFEIGTDPDVATVSTQNRVALAEPILPEEARRLGIVVKKRSTNLLALCSLREKRRLGANGEPLPLERDDLFLSNFASIFVKDRLARVEGVGEAAAMDARDYGMRVWLDPDLAATRGLSTLDVVRALKEQNVQVAAGFLGADPTPAGRLETLPISTRGRLETAKEFGETAIRVDELGRVLKLRDVARVELGKYDYSRTSTFDGTPSATIALYATPNANALRTMERVRAALDELGAELDDEGLELVVGYDSTRFVSAAVAEVEETLIFAVLIVVGVVYFFLQDWRAAAIPATTIPVSLVGCFAPLAVWGFSLNTPTLFGLTLAVGIVVDDAIVVVENARRILTQNPNLTGREAARTSARQVAGPIVATTCVVAAVFLPTTLVGGTTGRMFAQFAATIVVSTAISALCALSISPALCALLLRGDEKIDKNGENGKVGVGRATRRVVGRVCRVLLFGWFNVLFGAFSAVYAVVLRWTLRFPAFALVVWGATVAGFLWGMSTLPTGFLPNEDQGVLFVDIRLPDGASSERTAAATRAVERILDAAPGRESTIVVRGYSLLDGVSAPNLALAVLTLKDWRERRAPGESADALKARLTAELDANVPEARCVVFAPPPISGVGTSGGVEFELLDRRESGAAALSRTSRELAERARETGRFLTVVSSFNPASPKLFLDVDREKAKQLGVDLTELFATLQTYLGATYVNDFNLFGRTFRVVAQADGPFRTEETKLLDLPILGADGRTLPLRSVATLERTTGPRYLSRFNMSPATFLVGVPAPGTSSGEGIRALETLGRDLPRGFEIDWTGASYQEREAGGAVVWAFVFATVFGFLALAAQYESWSAPFVVMSAVPLGASGALLALALRKFPIDLNAQIGLVLTVALSAKNAILITEFAKELRDAGKGLVEAATIAGKTRLRPITMTSLAFILGVLPLVVARGAGAAGRRTIGTAVCGGMLEETFVGIVVTPALFVVVTGLAERGRRTFKRIIGNREDK